MSRFLTPTKTTLLLLITIYLEGAVPSSSIVTVLSFIVKNVLPAEKHDRGPPGLDGYERALSTQKSIITGRSVWDLLLKKLWSIDSVDTYHAFFDSLHSLHAVPKPPQDPEDADEPLPESSGIKLSRASPLGAFVRRTQIEFTRLTFGDSVSLWNDFVAFRQPSFPAWRKRNASLSRTSFDANLAELEDERIQTIVYGDLHRIKADTGFYSTDDIDRLLDFQVAQMSKTGHRMPDSVRQQLEKLAKSQLTIPSAVHYVKFLDAWKAGDYPKALDCLHRYFDYTIQTREKSHYQYALLNMAQLYANFGCHAEAISAMQETISTARENKDMACLNYSLSWLFHFGQAHPEEAKDVQKSGVLGNGKEALHFLRTKAKESSSWILLSSTLVSEARLGIINGDGLAPAVENLVRASYINLTKRVHAGIAAQMAVESALWQRLGVSELAATKTEIFLECYQDEAMDDDKLGAICRVSAGLAASGKAEEAFHILDTMPSDNFRSLRMQTRWSVQMGILKLRQAILRGNLIAADHYLNQLRAIPNIDGDHTTQIAILQIKIHMKRGNLPTAMALLDTTSQTLDKQHGDVANRVQLMILKVAIWDQAAKPQKAFTVALRACSMAYEARLLVGLWEAVTYLCRILNALSEFAAARDLLVSCLPQILTTPERELSAHAYSVLADAHMGLAGRAEQGSIKRKEAMTKCLEYLDSAFDHCSVLDDVSGQCEMLMKKATIMYLNGDHLLANDFAAKSFEIRESYRDDIES